MSLFQQIVETLPSVSFTLGQQVRISLPRDFPYEGFMITADITVSAVAATIAPEGVYSLFKRMQLTVNDGGQNRDLVNADGFSIVQRHVGYNSNLDTESLTSFSNAFSSTGAKTIRLYHFFAPNELEDPVRSIFLANFPRFNNDPTLLLTMGAQADIDTNAAPTFAISAGTIRVVSLKRFVTSDAWTFLKTDFITQEQAFPTTVVQNRYNIPIPGWHFSLAFRMYSSATALGDITTAGSFNRVSALNVTERVLTTQDLRALNYLSIGSDVSTTTNGTQRAISATSYVFDYLTDYTGAVVTNLDTLLNSNPYVALGASPQIVQDITGGTGRKIVYMHDRCYGDVAPATILPQILGRR